MTDNMNIMTALYSTSRNIEPVDSLAVLSIHWCTCEINSYKIMFLAPCVGSDRPTTTDPFVWGPALMDQEYPDNHRKSQVVSFHAS